jgi:hypothetical protein
VGGKGGARELVPEVRVPIWGIGGGGAHRGGLIAAKQIGGGELATAGQRRGGERRLRVCGAAVSSGGGRCGDGGARRWRLTGRWSPQPKEAAGSVLRRFLTADGGSTVGLAWLRGARERCGVVGTLTLGAEECGDEGAEADGESKVEWAGVRRLSREEERRLLLRTDSATR